MKKFLFIILLLGVAAFFGYNYYTDKNREESLAEKLKSSTDFFQIAIFHDSKFTNLQEHKISGNFDASKMPVGNKNPFQADKAPEQAETSIK